MNNFLIIWNSTAFKYIVFTICAVILITYLSKIGDNACISDKTRQKGRDLASRVIHKTMDSYG